MTDERPAGPPPPPRSAPVSLRHRLEYAALVAIDAILRALPLETASALMGRLWRWFGPLNRRHARAADNLAKAMPELGVAARRKILAGMWDNLGRVAAESLQLGRIVADPSRIEFVPSAEVAAAIEPGKGAIFVSIHSGNWELVSASIPRYGLEAAAVYRALKNPLVERLMHARRSPLYPAGLIPRNRTAGVRLAGLARRGAGVAMLGDLRDRHGVVIDVFGRPSYASSAPVALARRLGLPLVLGRIVRTGGVRFRVEAELLELPDTGDDEADVLAGTRRLNARFEAWIREHPEQWMWILRRWLD